MLRQVLSLLFEVGWDGVKDKGDAIFFGIGSDLYFLVTTFLCVKYNLTCDYLQYSRLGLSV